MIWIILYVICTIICCGIILYVNNLTIADYPAKYTVAEFAKDCAYALVEKMKEERK